MPDTTTKLLIDATYRLAADDVDAFKALAVRMAADATKRDGCVFLKVAQDLADAGTIHLFEAWRDQEALDAHLASDGFKAVLKEAGELKITDYRARTYDVSGSTPLEMPS